MTVLLAATAAALFAIGTYLVLQRKLSRIIIGLGVADPRRQHPADHVGPARRTRPIIGSAARVDVQRPAPAGAGAHRHRHHVRRHHAPARARLPQLAAHPRRRGRRRRRRPRHRPRPTSCDNDVADQQKAITETDAEEASGELARSAPHRASAARRRPVHPGRAVPDHPAHHRRHRAHGGARHLGRAARRGRPQRTDRRRRPAAGPRRSGSRSSPTASRRSCSSSPRSCCSPCSSTRSASRARNATTSASSPSTSSSPPASSLAFLTGDLFNLFVAFEMMLTASYVLLTLGGTREQVRSGMTYVVISLLASTLFVTALALLYSATGTVNMADLADQIRELPDGLQSAFAVLLVVVFGIKAALFPLFFWLPDSYPTAPVADHRGVRRAPHQGRDLRHHPHPDAVLPARQPGRRRCCSCSPRPRWSSASSAPSPRTTSSGSCRSTSSARSGTW